MDIGANMVDPMFEGIYNSKQAHSNDLQQVLERARKVGLKEIIITSGSLQDLKRALELCNLEEGLYTTIGVHPTRASDFVANADALLEELLVLYKKHKHKIVAVGEFGLDYERTQYCDPTTQTKYFEFQFQLADQTGLPLFLHLRNAFSDFYEIIKRNRHRFSTGVVHSFDGTKEEMDKLTELGLYIGINGCSLKTAQNLEVVGSIPKELLMIETDAPWCQIRPSHASSKYVKTKFVEKPKEKWQPEAMVKGRNEPANIIQVLEVISQLQNQKLEDLAQVIYKNSKQVFFPQHPINQEQRSSAIEQLKCVTLSWKFGGEEVFVAGSWNNWKKERMERKDSNANWLKQFQLKPGEYLYKFIVDGVWTFDASQPHQTQDHWNNILLI
uniref:AMP-activated protein kinase glycogen-binding domain-containing protein n=1 Tax=Arcella intermedia TaxID=1963864 RepID=A0A6B2L708_9EUKA